MGGSFTDANNGMAVGDGGAIVRTTDGGITWTSPTISKTNLLSGVSFADINNGTAVGYSGKRDTDKRFVFEIVGDVHINSSRL